MFAIAKRLYLDPFFLYILQFRSIKNKAIIGKEREGENVCMRSVSGQEKGLHWTNSKRDEIQRDKKTRGFGDGIQTRAMGVCFSSTYDMDGKWLGK